MMYVVPQPQPLEQKYLQDGGVTCTDQLKAMSDEVDVGWGGFGFRSKRNHFDKYLGVRLCWGTPRPNKGPMIGVSVILFKS